MSLRSKLRVFAGEDDGFDALSTDVCERDAALRKEPKCEGKYDMVTYMPIENADAYCLKGLCLEKNTMARFIEIPDYARGTSNPLQPYVTNAEWKQTMQALRQKPARKAWKRIDPNLTKIVVEGKDLVSLVKEFEDMYYKVAVLKTVREVHIVRCSFGPVEFDMDTFLLEGPQLSPSFILEQFFTLPIETVNISYCTNIDTSEAFSTFDESPLKSLTICNSNITDADATNIARKLKDNRALKLLDLSRNRIGDVGGRALYDALESNGSLIELKLDGNPMSPSIVAGIQARLDLNRLD